MTTSDRGRKTVPARDPPAGETDSTQSTLSELQGEVISAVRGAITGVMAGRQTAAEMPDLDMDFSVSIPPAKAALPALRAEPERALAVLSTGAPPRRWRGLLLAAAIGTVGAGGIAALWFLQGHPPEPARVPGPAAASVAAVTASPITAKAAPTVASASVVAPTPPPAEAEPVDPVLSARDLMQRGRIAAARKILLASPNAVTSAIALEIARSYDPNYLVTLPSADAEPDLEQARTWYRRWYGLGVVDGTVPSTMRLDLLLRSLEKPKPVN